jgi:predicted nucleic acid-binding Zn ribbon protein
MLKNGEFWLLTVLAAGALVLALVNMFMFSQNRETQGEVNSRAQYIQQSVQLDGLYREMVKALADLAVRTNDKQIGDLLAAHGISVTVGPAASAPPAADVKKGEK